MAANASAAPMPGRHGVIGPFYRLIKCAVALFALPMALGGPALAQSWPPKTVRILVPFGPGSTPDIVARLIADGLVKKYPDSIFLVENKPGASGNLATDAVRSEERRVGKSVDL